MSLVFKAIYLAVFLSSTFQLPSNCFEEQTRFMLVDNSPVQSKIALFLLSACAVTTQVFLHCAVHRRCERLRYLTLSSCFKQPGVCDLDHALGSCVKQMLILLCFSFRHTSGNISGVVLHKLEVFLNAFYLSICIAK